MKKQTKEEVTPLYTKTDYDSFRAKLQAVTPGKGRYGSALFVLMEQEGVIRFEDGELQVSNPFLYTRYSQMVSNIERWDMADEDKLFRDHPELKEEALQKRSAFIREMSKDLSLKKRVENFKKEVEVG